MAYNVSSGTLNPSIPYRTYNSYAFIIQCWGLLLFSGPVHICPGARKVWSARFVTAFLAKRGVVLHCHLLRIMFLPLLLLLLLLLL